MKKVLAVFLALAMILSLAACGEKKEEGSAPVEQEAMTLTVATNFAEDYISWQAMVKATETITEKTGGKITFELYPAEQLVKTNELFEAVTSGIIDMAPLLLENYAGVDPYFGAAAQFGLFDDIDHQINAWEAGQKDLLSEALDPYGVKLLGLTIPYSSGTQYMTTFPVHAPADIKGKNIRVFGSANTIMTELAGGNCINMSSSEYYLALQTGAIDGLTGNLVPSLGRSVQEVISYILDLNFSMSEDFAVINNNTWDKLTDETKQIFIDAFNIDNYTRPGAAQAEKNNEDAKKIYEAAGVEFIAPTDAEKAEWLELAAKTREEFLKATGEKGAAYVKCAEDTRK